MAANLVITWTTHLARSFGKPEVGSVAIVGT
jgi:hypothetical protein